ncbi:HEPN domain-containing protein [Pectobacterium zantedeschiae]|uniref:Apea-like HEPN domain-containing protein n=1 Tax=Pectobacterium zantedeschiae TaxID=2034769 RepID=A0A9X8P6X0_9GAMM|nr:HEPN domain-containing protein [Pectobacterium zantedeschiae]RYC37349.1 hypothetical protein CTN06_20820 [Pectobacterium zantedeschiae]RYC42597.1 hypothetical protein CTN06_14860 [Pectobacterium zantedeschiae]RYC45835.1 hypothetical protein CLR69_12990 [Pectobacterium zantedeschiae]
MNLKDIISDIVRLIDNRDFSCEKGFPDTITTRSGIQISYISDVRYKIELFKDIIKADLKHPLNNISNNSLYDICRNSICDLYTEKTLHEGIEDNSRSHIKKLKKEIEERVHMSLTTLTHHFPAHTCLFPLSEAISIGPVTFYPNLQWVKKLELHDNYTQQTLAPDEDLVNWKEELIKLTDPLERYESENHIANRIYSIIKKSNTILEIEIKNFEFNLSRKLAKIATQATIDSFSLIFNNEGMFKQQNLYEHPTLPFSFNTLASYKGRLVYPGMTLTERTPVYNGATISTFLNENKEFIDSAGNIIDSVINIKNYPNKDLSIRWTTSLNWYAEAQREQDDAIALAKIGISLDVLSGGGEWVGILEMVKNILGLDDQHVIFEKPHKTVLKEFISDLYNKGRSQIVHGNHIDRLIPFEQERKKASKMCRVILMASAHNLMNYSGDGSHNAFVKMAHR